MTTAPTPPGETSARPAFEDQWRRRFGRFAARHEEDSLIAGWTEAGLGARVRAFERLWRPGQAGEAWLDAGCGAGTYSRVLARHGLKMVGLDYSWPSIEKAAARGSGIDWIVGDVTRLPLRSESFAGVLCFGVLQALVSSEPALDELVAAVRPGGQIWVDALNAWCLPHVFERVCNRLRRRPTHVRYESPRRLRRAMRARALVDIRMHWIPIAPARLRFLQGLLEDRRLHALLRRIPPLGALFSHAFVLEARRPGAGAAAALTLPRAREGT